MKLLLRLVGLLLFISVLYFYVDLDKLGRILSSPSWHFFILSVILIPLLIYIKSIRWKKVLAKYDIFYSGWKCFRIYFVEMVTITLVSTIGTFVKVLYPKRDGYGLFYPILSIVGDKYFDYLLPIIFGTASAGFIIFGVRPDVGLLIMLGISILLYVPAKKLIRILAYKMLPNRLKSLLLKKGRNTKEDIVKVEKSLDWNNYGFSLAGFCVFYLTVYFLVKGLSIDLSLSQVVLVMTVTSLISSIPLSFLGLGTRDVGLILVFRCFGHTGEEAVALSMGLLFIRIVTVFIGSIFWFMDPPVLRQLRNL